MVRSLHFATVLAVLAAGALLPLRSFAEEISGEYLETRTCDVWTGPCFANSEVGLTGREAIMAWSIEQGTHNGIDLAGLKVVMAIRASDTLGYGNALVVNPDPIKSVVLVDQNANTEQQDALLDFARQHAGRVGGEVKRVAAVPIEMSLDFVQMVASLKAGDEAELLTRKLGKHECVCTNESVFYPPLTEVEYSAPAFTVNARFTGRGLGVRWSIPKSRSAFLATFSY